MAREHNNSEYYVRVIQRLYTVYYTYSLLHIIFTTHTTLQEALKKRLEEIGMSEFEDALYRRFYDPVATEIAQLQVILYNTYYVRHYTMYDTYYLPHIVFATFNAGHCILHTLFTTHTTDTSYLLHTFRHILQVILQGVETRAQEREFLKLQTHLPHTTDTCY